MLFVVIFYIPKRASNKLEPKKNHKTMDLLEQFILKYHILQNLKENKIHKLKELMIFFFKSNMKKHGSTIHCFIIYTCSDFCGHLLGVQKTHSDYTQGGGIPNR